MRFFVSPEPWAERARPPVRWFLAFSAVMLFALAAQRALAGGLTPQGVADHYLGPDGAEPLAAVALWEEVHVNAFLYGFLLFTVGSLLAVCRVRPRLRSGLLWGGAIAAMADLFAPFAVLVAPGAAALRVATFTLTILALGAGVAVAFLRFGAVGNSRG